MFSQKIVFVIGAGASAEYGLPVGSQLIASLTKKLNFRKDRDGNLIGDRNFYEILGHRFGDKANTLRKASTELALRLGEFDSIDEALRWFSASPEILAVGKAAIVRHMAASVFCPGNGEIQKM